MSKKSRLEAIIGHYSDGKPSVFAKFLGVAPSTISSWLSRDTMDYDLIFAKCENLSSEWLLTGQGAMLKQTTHDDDERPANTLEDRRVPEDEEGGLPLIPMDAIAGFPSYDINGVVLADCERYRIPEFEANGAQFVIRVSGDSMLPTFHNGDILGCRKIEQVIFYQWGEAYVLDTSQGPLLKRLRPIEGDDECVQCVSDNTTNYPPFPIPKSDIRSLSTIVGLIRLM